MARNLLNVEKLERNAPDLRRKFQTAEPFSHLVVFTGLMAVSRNISILAHIVNPNLGIPAVKAYFAYLRKTRRERAQPPGDGDACRVPPFPIGPDRHQRNMLHDSWQCAGRICPHSRKLATVRIVAEGPIRGIPRGSGPVIRALTNCRAVFSYQLGSAVTGSRVRRVRRGGAGAIAVSTANLFVEERIWAHVEPSGTSLRNRVRRACRQ
ncbi:hypothetical protein [Mycolicibacterium chitae]|uniref:hypothetical protein n=1 Tax=Mycolicibacterium chitae TaxID=1792 RepID=UPI000F84C588|nr:hypothetical protein [Mycolicibacterium chitae]MCV7106052.1 hypothetical protein [Mycolicibacterium chitae]